MIAKVELLVMLGEGEGEIELKTHGPSLRVLDLADAVVDHAKRYRDSIATRAAKAAEVPTTAKDPNETIASIVGAGNRP